MSKDRKNAITVGLLFIGATLAGVLCLPMISFIDESSDFLTAIVSNENKVLMGALLQIIMAIFCGSIAVWLYPVLSRYNKPLALWAVVFRAIEAVIFMFGVALLLGMLSISRAYVVSDGSEALVYRTVAESLQWVSDWSGHVLASMAFLFGAFMYYAVFYVSRLIPRWLSAWGMIGSVVWFASIVMILFGITEPYSTVNILTALPVAINEMVLAGWLIVKGYERSDEAYVEVHEF